MSLQLRFGIAGAALGLVIGIIGCIVAAAPLGIFILKSFVALAVCGVLGFILHAVFKAFFPQLLEEADASGPEDALGVAASVNITLPEEGYPADAPFGEDQAAPLRQAYREAGSEAGGLAAEGGGEDEDDMIEEVSEDRRARPIHADSLDGASFDEASFYEGVDRLPDIGGFSEQFQPGDGAADAGESDVPDVSGARPKGSSRSGSPQGNMDPSLIAQAIRTALKKDDL